MTTSVFFIIALMATPLWAQPSLPPVSVPSAISTLPTVTPKIPIPNVNGTCKCPLIPDLQVLDCILDFISHVNILTKTVETVNGTQFNKYTIQHLEILKGGLELPSVVLVPMGPCGLELEVDVEYLLSGLLTGESNLYSGLCLQILTGVLSPVWSLVDDALIKQIGLLQTVQDLVCQLLEGLIEPLLGKLLVVLPGLDALGGLTGGLGGVGGLTGGLGGLTGVVGGLTNGLGLGDLLGGL